MLTIEQAYCGYNSEQRAYVPYTGRLTAEKEKAARAALIAAGFSPGWKTKNVRIEKPDANGLALYCEDGAGGIGRVVVLSGIGGCSSKRTDADDEAHKLTEENEVIAEAKRCYWMVEAL